MSDSSGTTGLTNAPVLAELNVAVTGMTCASCVARVERRINKIPGATATVNLPLETAHIELTGEVTDAEIIAAIERAGYDGRITERLDKTGATAEPENRSSQTQSPASGQDDSADPSGEVDNLAYGDTSAPGSDRGADLKNRLIFSAILALPVMVLSMIPAIQFTGWQWLVAAMTLPVVTWGAWPFHRAAFKAAKYLSSTMDTLVSLGVIAASLWSMWALLFGGAGELGMKMTMSLFPARSVDGQTAELYFEVAAMVTAFLLAGRYAEYRSRRSAGNALRSLLELGAKDVLRVTEVDGKRSEERIAITDLRQDDLFTVKPGEKIATDGLVIEGHSAIDTSLLTGEPVPVEVGPEDFVTGATINTSGHLLVKATRVGKDTTLASIARLVTNAQTGKAPVQRLADRISGVFVPIVIVIALLTFGGWMLWGPSLSAAFTASVAVLIIACPCALGLATPTALLVGTGRGAQLGVLIKGPETLESTRRVDTIILDKTGTVTEGKMSVERVTGHADTLRYAAAVEALSEHPIAQAIAQFGKDNVPTELQLDGVDRDFEVTEFQNAPGGGVTGLLRLTHSGVNLSVKVLVGRPQWLADQGIAIESPELNAAFDQGEADGATVIATGWNGQWQGIIVLRDSLKETSAEAIAQFKELGLTPHLLTGDNQGAALATARAAGIAPGNVIAKVLPEQKVEVVERLRAEGKIVAMVGDGVNDAAALATADLGLAMGTGTDVAIEASDITLVRGDLRAAATAIRLSRQTLRIIKQNLFWAFFYNVAALPLAAAGLLNPMIAGAAMAASSVIVVSNSLRLRKAG